jgi:hypothetical protein
MKKLTTILIGLCCLTGVAADTITLPIQMGTLGYSGGSEEQRTVEVSNKTYVIKYRLTGSCWTLAVMGPTSSHHDAIATVWRGGRQIGPPMNTIWTGGKCFEDANPVDLVLRAYAERSGGAAEDEIDEATLKGLRRIDLESLTNSGTGTFDWGRFLASATSYTNYYGKEGMRFSVNGVVLWIEQETLTNQPNPTSPLTSWQEFPVGVLATNWVLWGGGATNYCGDDYEPIIQQGTNLIMIRICRKEHWDDSWHEETTYAQSNLLSFVAFRGVTNITRLESICTATNARKWRYEKTKVYSN